MHFGPDPNIAMGMLFSSILADSVRATREPHSKVEEMSVVAFGIASAARKAADPFVFKGGARRVCMQLPKATEEAAHLSGSADHCRCR